MERAKAPILASRGVSFRREGRRKVNLECVNPACRDIKTEDGLRQLEGIRDTSRSL